MRLSIVVFALALSGCATQSADVRECIGFLPPARYTVIDQVRFKSWAIMEIIRAEARENHPSISGYLLPPPRPSTARFPPRKSLVLLRSKPDELVLCEINGPGCNPTLTWLASDDKSATYRIAEMMEGECVLY